MAKKDRVYKWVKGSAQYRSLIKDLERRGWSHHLDYSRRSDAFRGAGANGIVIGRRAEHPKGIDTYTVWERVKRVTKMVKSPWGGLTPAQEANEARISRIQRIRERR